MLVCVFDVIAPSVSRIISSTTNFAMRWHILCTGSLPLSNVHMRPQTSCKNHRIVIMYVFAFYLLLLFKFLYVCCFCFTLFEADPNTSVLHFLLVFSMI